MDFKEKNDLADFKKQFEDQQNLSYNYLKNQLLAYDIKLDSKPPSKSFLESLTSLYMKLKETENNYKNITGKMSKFKTLYEESKQKKKLKEDENKKLSKQNSELNKKIKILQNELENERKSNESNLKQKNAEISRMQSEQIELRDKITKNLRGKNKFEIEGNLKKRKDKLKNSEIIKEKILIENNKKLILQYKSFIEKYYLSYKEIFEGVKTFFEERKKILTSKIYNVKINNDKYFSNFSEIEKKIVDIKVENLNFEEIELIKDKFKSFLNFVEDFEIFIAKEPDILKKKEKDLIFEKIDIFDEKIFSHIRNQQKLETLINDYNSVIEKNKENDNINNYDVDLDVDDAIDSFSKYLKDLDNFIEEKNKDIERLKVNEEENNYHLEESQKLINEIFVNK